MPKTSKELSREAQVLKAFSLQSEGMSLTESCKEAGIAKRTYQRWSESVLGKVEYELAEIKAQMAAQAVGAWPLAVADAYRLAVAPHKCYVVHTANFTQWIKIKPLAEKRTQMRQRGVFDNQRGLCYNAESLLSTVDPMRNKGQIKGKKTLWFQGSRCPAKWLL